MQNDALTKEERNNYPCHEGCMEAYRNGIPVLSTPHPEVLTVVIMAIYSCAACGLHHASHFVVVKGAAWILHAALFTPWHHGAVCKESPLLS